MVRSKENPDQTLSEEDKTNLTKNIVEFVTDDKKMQTYLYSNFHQSGILMISQAVMVSPSLYSISKYAETLKAELEYPTLFKKSNLPKHTCGIHIQTNPDGSLEVLSQAMFSDIKTDIENPEYKENYEPLFLSSVRLKISLIDNPEAKDDDPPERKENLDIPFSGYLCYAIKRKRILRHL